MINFDSEKLLPLNDTPTILPGQANGTRVHISGVQNLVQQSMRGARREAVRIGGTANWTLMQRSVSPSHLQKITPAIWNFNLYSINVAFYPVHKVPSPIQFDLRSAIDSTTRQKTRD